MPSHPRRAGLSRLGSVQRRLDRAETRLRKKLPAHLERVEVVIEPEAATCRTSGFAERVKIGEDVYDWCDGYNNFSDWVAKAATQAG